MVGRDLSEVVRQLRRMVRPRGDTAPADAQLLHRFTDCGDEAAFEMLLARHGPMVLALCRRLLHNVQDAEDAFQATFLVLVRKAGSLRERDLLANWLYGVAYRIAVRVRANNARRQVLERLDGDRVGAADFTPAAPDLRWLLEEELGRLPEKYRQPVVLCYLEGQSNEEAARHLRWPVGTVKGRLARARDLLRRRLTRRGVTVSSAALAAALSSNSVAALPPPLIVSTVRAALGLAAGEAAALGGVSASVLSLAQGSSRGLALASLKAVVMVALVTAALVPAAGVLVRQAMPPTVDRKTDLTEAKQATSSIHASPAVAESVDLKVRWPDGHTFYQEITTESTQVMTIMHKETRQHQSQTLWIRCTPRGQKDSKLVMKLKIDGIKGNIDGADFQSHYDSTAKNQAANPWGKFFSAFVGHEFTVYLNADATSGKYLRPVKVEGREAPVKKLQLLDKTPVFVLGALLSEEGIAQLANPFTGLLTGRVMHQGETWSVTASQDLGPLGRYSNEYHYQYHGRAGALDHISVRSHTTQYVPAPPAEQMVLPFVVVKADVKRRVCTGNIFFDRARGRIGQAVTETRFEGKHVIRTGGMDVEVDMMQTDRITLRVSDTSPLP